MATSHELWGASSVLADLAGTRAMQQLITAFLLIAGPAMFQPGMPTAPQRKLSVEPQQLPLS